jgi:hypothetical protein
MKLFKKKKKTKQHSPIRLPKSGVTPTRNRRKSHFKLSKIFNNKKKSKYGTSRRRKKNIKYLAIPAILLVIGGLFYLALKYVLFLRENAYGEDEYVVTNVLGFEELPSYYNSEFLFLHSMEDSVVKEFLSSGNSAYTLPPGTTTEELEEYYMETLKPLGWEFVQSVTKGTGDKKYGQYWIKDGKGLRIYSKYNDVWYETITQEDARSALASVVQEEIEREMLMATSEKQDLLPDYPWEIQIPKEYMIKYSPTDMDELRAVSFQRMGSNEIVEIFPVGYWRSKELDYMLEDYCNIKSSEENTYGVINSIPITFQDNLGLKSTITSQEESLVAYTIPNTFNTVVYVISSNEESSPLLQYIIENIKPWDNND